MRWFLIAVLVILALSLAIILMTAEAQVLPPIAHCGPSPYPGPVPEECSFGYMPAIFGKIEPTATPVIPDK